MRLANDVFNRAVVDLCAAAFAKEGRPGGAEKNKEAKNRKRQKPCGLWRFPGTS
jgi:hypothetical protein